MKKKCYRFTAMLIALLIPMSLASCKGVDQAVSPESAGMISSESISSTQSTEEQTSSEQVSSDTISSIEASSDAASSGKESSKENSSESNSSGTSGKMETVPELPSSSEPLNSTKVESVSSVEQKIDEANIEVKSAETKAPQADATSSQQEKPTYKTAISSKTATSSKQTDASSKAESGKAPSQAAAAGDKINHSEMKAVWLSFLEFQSFAGSSESGYTSKINSILDAVVAKGLNTVIVQVRPYGDSFYESDYYPWSKCVSGTMGVGVNYDPVDIVVREAHVRGLSIHAWINPYRTMTDKEFATVDDRFATKKWYNSQNRNSYMVYNQQDGRYWLQPGNAEVQNLIINGAKEIVQRYDVDGVHLDDYFYCASPSSYGDTAAQAKANTTAMVKGLYDGIKSVDKNVLFGVSPAGGFRMANSLPESDRNYLSTDLALWCSQPGYLDYVMPQIYWEHTHSIQPFTETLQKWGNLVTAPGVSLYVGLAPYRLSATEIQSQVEEIAADSGADGYCLFRYDFIHGLTL